MSLSMEAALLREIMKTEEQNGQYDEGGTSETTTTPAIPVKVRSSKQSQIGRRRFRRVENERELAELCGPLTAEDMDALYQPVPFGESYPRPLEELAKQRGKNWDDFVNARDEDCPVWMTRDCARSRSTPTRSGWAAVQPKPRLALRKCFSGNDPVLEELESLVLALKGRSEKDVLQVNLESAYHRLILHGLSSYYGCVSGSSNNSSGERVVTVRKRKTFEEVANPWTKGGCGTSVSSWLKNASTNEKGRSSNKRSFVKL